MPTTMPALALRSLREYLAYPVRDHASRFGCSGDDRATRAHTKTVDRAAVGGVMNQFVVGCADHRVPAKRPSRARSIIDCGCSMRKPMANGFASMEDGATFEHA
jgi:hypothetical protein